MNSYHHHITDYLDHNAATMADKLAVVTDERSVTWTELKTESQLLAMLLSSLLGNGRQKIVAVLLPNSWQFVVIYAAVLRAGHMVMPLDASFKKLEIAAITQQLRPDIVITDKDFQFEFDQALPVRLFEELADLSHSKPSGPQSSSSLASLKIKDKDEDQANGFIRMAAEEQIATLLFTSGTTGKPKVTAYSHTNHLWNPAVMEELWQWTSQDSLLIALPLSHWHGLVMGIAGGFYYGNTMYLRPRFEAEDVLATIDRYHISLFMHVPIAYWKLNQVERPERFNLSSIRLWVSGSSYLPPAVWQTFKDIYGVEILERYGSSETGLIASNRLEERVPGSVGYVLPGVRVEQQPDGELAMDSAGRFLGYFGNTELTANNTLANGLWLTGDIGQVAPSGRIVLKGRIQEKMKKSGYTIFPRDVEWAMLQSPTIEDIFVAGIQDPEGLSDRIVYFVVGKADEAAVRAFAKEHLPASWRPDMIMLLEELPKTRSGKPKRRELLEMVE